MKKEKSFFKFLITFIMIIIFIYGYLNADRIMFNFQTPINLYLILLFLTLLIIFSQVVLPYFKTGRNSFSYNRLEAWIVQKIGNPDKKMSEHVLKGQLEELFRKEKSRISEEKYLRGFRRYIDLNRYRNMLK